MTIDRVLHVLESGRMDFYSASYFATMIDVPFFYEKGTLIGYGKDGNEYGAVNLTRARSCLRYYSLRPETASGGSEEDFAIEETGASRTLTPYVPPSKVKVSATEVEHDTEYMNYWLSYYNECTPKYVTPSAHDYSVCTLVDQNGNPVSMAEGATQQRIPEAAGYMFDFRHYTIEADTTLPICNGFACYPEVIERRLVAPKIGRFYGDMTNRNRGTWLVDFSPVGGCTFKRMRACSISRTGAITIPTNEYNPSTQSMIVVLAGRILTAEQYYVLGNSITFKQRPLSPLSLVDEKICAGELLTGNTIITETVNMDKLIYDDNSFFIIVNKPKLQIVQHPMWWATSEPIKPNPVQTLNTFANSHKVQFDRQANGLLIDKVTQLVYDYTREEHTVTFYAENSEPVTWETMTATVRPEQPIVRLNLGGSDNFMSARGTLFTTPTNIAKEDHVMWPNFVLYDFVFRG